MKMLCVSYLHCLTLTLFMVPKSLQRSYALLLPRSWFLTNHLKNEFQ